VTAVVLASNNAGKLREFAELLQGVDFEVLPQARFAVAEVEETGVTFVENALLKARHASALSGLPAMADDSGLEVDALRGAPGVRSARYAGPRATDRENIEKLLDALAGVPDDRRTGRFQCIICYLRHAADPTPVICQGTWDGRILPAPRGRHGFGYDPVFLARGVDCSAAELPLDIKNRVSHRARALRALLERLRGTAS
jgi:XTP/dITP diphosphohydrolase